MGNCINLQKPVSWVDEEGDEEWVSMEHKKAHHAMEKGGAASTTEITIKISKKELEELLRRADGKDMPFRKVLADIMSLGEPWKVVHDRERHWRPKLQSIPEVPE